MTGGKMSLHPEDHSGSTASRANQGVDDSDIYDDLGLKAAAQQSQDAWSVGSDINDADIYQEMGVQPIDYTTEEGSIDNTAAYKKAKQSKPANNQEVISIDFENLRKILRADLSGKSSGCGSKENQQVKEIHDCETNSVEKETEREIRAKQEGARIVKAEKIAEKFQEGSDEKGSGRLNPNKVLTENKQHGARAKTQSSVSGSENTKSTPVEDNSMQNRDLHFVLSMLCKKNSTMEDLMQNNVTDEGKTGPITGASVSNSSECIENSDSPMDSPRKSKRIKDIQKEATSTRTHNQSSEIGLNTSPKRLPASSFMSIETSPRKTQSEKQSEEASKADCQWDLFEDVMVARSDEKESQEVTQLKEEMEALRVQLKESEKRCEGLEHDNKLLLTNISSLWKTAISQIKQKIQQINSLRAEREAILFRRAMRQVPKEEFDAVLSQISKYSSDEFKSFLESMKKTTDEGTSCKCGGKGYAGFGGLVEKITASVVGVRVNSSQDTDAASLKNLMGKGGKNVTSLVKPQQKATSKKRKISTQKQNNKFDCRNEDKAGKHIERKKCDFGDVPTGRNRHDSGDRALEEGSNRIEDYGKPDSVELQERHDSGNIRHRNDSGDKCYKNEDFDLEFRHSSSDRPLKRRRHESGERYSDGDRHTGRFGHSNGERNSRLDRYHSDLDEEYKKRNIPRNPGKSIFERRKGSENRKERNANEEPLGTDRRLSVFSRLGAHGKSHFDRSDQKKEYEDVDRRQEDNKKKTSKFTDLQSDESLIHSRRTRKRDTDNRNTADMQVIKKSTSSVSLQDCQMTTKKGHNLSSDWSQVITTNNLYKHEGECSTHVQSNSTSDIGSAIDESENSTGPNIHEISDGIIHNACKSNSDCEEKMLGKTLFGQRVISKPSQTKQDVQNSSSKLPHGAKNHINNDSANDSGIINGNSTSDSASSVGKPQEPSAPFTHKAKEVTGYNCDSNLYEEEEMLGKSLFGQRMNAKMARAKKKMNAEIGQTKQETLEQLARPPFGVSNHMNSDSTSVVGIVSTNNTSNNASAVDKQQSLSDPLTRNRSYGDSGNNSESDAEHEERMLDKSLFGQRMMARIDQTNQRKQETISLQSVRNHMNSDKGNTDTLSDKIEEISERVEERVSQDQERASGHRDDAPVLEINDLHNVMKEKENNHTVSHDHDKDKADEEKHISDQTLEEKCGDKTGTKLCIMKDVAESKTSVSCTSNEGLGLGEQNVLQIVLEAEKENVSKHVHDISVKRKENVTKICEESDNVSEGRPKNKPSGTDESVASKSETKTSGTILEIFDSKDKVNYERNIGDREERAVTDEKCIGKRKTREKVEKTVTDEMCNEKNRGEREERTVDDKCNSERNSEGRKERRVTDEKCISERKTREKEERTVTYEKCNEKNIGEREEGTVAGEKYSKRNTGEREKMATDEKHNSERKTREREEGTVTDENHSSERKTSKGEKRKVTDEKCNSDREERTMTDEKCSTEDVEIGPPQIRETSPRDSSKYTSVTLGRLEDPNFEDKKEGKEGVEEKNEKPNIATRKKRGRPAKQKDTDVKAVSPCEYAETKRDGRGRRRRDVSEKEKASDEVCDNKNTKIKGTRMDTSNKMDQIGVMTRNRTLDTKKGHSNASNKERNDKPKKNLVQTSLSEAQVNCKSTGRFIEDSDDQEVSSKSNGRQRRKIGNNSQKNKEVDDTKERDKTKEESSKARPKKQSCCEKSARKQVSGSEGNENSLDCQENKEITLKTDIVESASNKSEQELGIREPREVIGGSENAKLEADAECVHESVGNVVQCQTPTKSSADEVQCQTMTKNTSIENNEVDAKPPSSSTQAEVKASDFKHGTSIKQITNVPEALVDRLESNPEKSKLMSGEDGERVISDEDVSRVSEALENCTKKDIQCKDKLNSRTTNSTADEAEEDGKSNSDKRIREVPVEKDLICSKSGSDSKGDTHPVDQEEQNNKEVKLKKENDLGKKCCVQDKSNTHTDTEEKGKENEEGTDLHSENTERTENTKIEESLFPEEEELLYDEDSEDDDEDDDKKGYDSEEISQTKSLHSSQTDCLQPQTSKMGSTFDAKDSQEDAIQSIKKDNKSALEKVTVKNSVQNEHSPKRITRNHSAEREDLETVEGSRGRQCRSSPRKVGKSDSRKDLSRSRSPPGRSNRRIGKMTTLDKKCSTSENDSVSPLMVKEKEMQAKYEEKLAVAFGRTTRQGQKASKELKDSNDISPLAHSLGRENGRNTARHGDGENIPFEDKNEQLKLASENEANCEKECSKQDDPSMPVNTENGRKNIEGTGLHSERKAEPIKKPEESLFPGEEELLYDGDSEGGDDDEKENDAEETSKPEASEMGSLFDADNSQVDTLKENGDKSVTESVQNREHSPKRITRNHSSERDFENVQRARGRKCSVSPRKNDRSDSSIDLSACRSPIGKSIKRIMRLTPNKKCEIKENDSVSPLMVKEKEMQAKYEEKMAVAFGRTTRQGQRAVAELDDTGRISPPIHSSKRVSGRNTSRRRDSESPPRERGRKPLRSKEGEHMRTDHEKINSERSTTSRSSDSRLRVKRMQGEELEETKRNKSLPNGAQQRRPTNLDDGVRGEVRRKRQQSESPPTYRRRQRVHERRMRDDGDSPDRGIHVGKIKNRNEIKEDGRNHGDPLPKVQREKNCAQDQQTRSKVPVDSKLLHKILWESPKKNIVQDDEKEEGELDEDEEEGELISVATNGGETSHKDSKESHFPKLEVEGRRRNEARWDLKNARPTRKSEILKYEKALQEAKEKHRRAEEDRKNRVPSKEPALSKCHRPDSTKDRFAWEKQDAFTGREKKINQVSEVNAEKRRQSMRARHLRTLMEDDTTFYPADLFQVTPILAVPEKVGPASGSDDTIDILVKQNHEKYGQESLSTSGDSEMSLLYFINDHEVKRCATSDRKPSSLKATGATNDGLKNQAEVEMKTKEQVVETRGLADEKASEQSLVKDNNVTIADTPLIDGMGQEHDSQNLLGNESLLNQCVDKRATGTGKEGDCHIENSLETGNVDQVPENTAEIETAYEDRATGTKMHINECSDVPMLNKTSATAQSTDAHEDNSSSSSDSDSDSDSDSSDCQCSKCGNSSSSSSSSSSCSSSSDSDSDSDAVIEETAQEATNTSVAGGESDQSKIVNHTNKKSPRKTPRKSPLKREKSPKKPSPNKSPHRTSKTPHKMLKTPHKSPGKVVQKTPGKTPCKKLGKTPRKSPSSKLKEPTVQISPDLHSMLEKNGITSAEDKGQNKAIDSQAPGTKRNTNKGHMISPPQIQMLICSHDDLKAQAKKREESGSGSQSQNSNSNGAPAAPSSSSSSTTIQKVFVRRRAKRPANFSPTKSAAMSLSCVSGKSAISLVHRDQQPSEETSNSDPKSIQDENIFKERNLATSECNKEEVILRKRTRTSVSEKTMASKRSRMLSPESREEIAVHRDNAERKAGENGAIKSEKSPAEANKTDASTKAIEVPKGPNIVLEETTGGSVRISTDASSATAANGKSTDEISTTDSKIIVPVKIRRVKRQLNLGLSSSVASVVSSVPERKSPLSSTAASTSASTPPPAKERSKSIENSLAGLRRSPRKKLGPT
ncbi:uncharacterized protein LOC125039162 [Penaeus chinensis]|uniref:uncharacterized protein LOC125039162 n=1 Tax=Penaeus chinensis TaxID=139456 RepID=UPI001FB84BF5|nr:uncharacterized protein LOC125039162 [Penaeus chinensis]